MKRSKTIALVAMGVSALALNACSEAQSEAAIYGSLKDCVAAGELPKVQCERAFGEAQKQHAEVAPKYKNKTDCEADMGAGKCETSPYRTSQGGSVWMPLMAGYMMGRMLGGGGVRSQPLYRSGDDKKNFRTADNKKVGARSGLVNVPKSSTRAPSRKMSISRRGGFGATGRGFGTRSFGG